ncbi:lysine--tRNA ligase [Patescibacteria group bacterium]|nr:lysine--tRNA ligase [Patescibacteria group bacterium]
MYWADEFAEKIIKSGKYKPYHVDDMKTPSGKIHVGALRGVVIHDLIHQALLAKGVKSVYTYVLNDMDPMDAFPHYLPEKFKQYMGWPLYKIPSPEPGFKSFSECYAGEFEQIFNGLGIKPKIIWSHREYRAGKFDQIIKTVLDKVELVRKLYHDVSGYDKPKNWYPYQVVCQKCGKVGTTIVTGWDGQKVSFTCQKDLVKWAKGCGFQGKIEPIKTNGKLMWKVDWAAHWQVLGVTVEGAGKDHMTEGGSHDLSSAICQQVLNYPTPFSFIYEWFLAKGGTKMSSSKGIGISATGVTQALPPELLKYLLVKTPYRRAIIFDPNNNDSILKLFDDYDQDMAAGNDSWKLAQVKPEVKPINNPPRFRDVVKYLQDPKVNLNQQFADTDQNELKKRIKYAKIWIDKYAPPAQVFQITKEIPEFAGTFTDTQREFLVKAHNLAKEAKSPEELQQKIYETGKILNFRPMTSFATIYQATIGKDHGPKAGWLLFNNPQAIQRLDEAANYIPTEDKTRIKSTLTNLLKLSPEFAQKYPSASIGFAVISGVKVAKFNPDLEKDRQAFAKSLAGLTTEALGQSPELLSYRRMYKNMGVDWHSKRPSPEALLRRIATGKGLYEPINTIVDAYNLVVMKNKISCGAFDAEAIKFPSEVKIAQGGETALYIGDKKTTEIQAGEVCYFDQIGAYNIDYNYRDAIRSLVTEKTTKIWINVDGIYDISPEQVQKTLKEAIAIITKYCGGQVKEIGLLLASDYD